MGSSAGMIVVVDVVSPLFDTEVAHVAADQDMMTM